MKRSLSLDFLRGFAIWMMIVFHVLLFSWGSIDNLSDIEYVLDLPVLLLLLAVVLTQFATWAGLFILISMCVNVLAVKRRIDQGMSLKKLRNKQLFTGFLIMMLGYITEATISYNGFLGYSLLRGELAWDGLHHGMLAWKALNVIGLCIIISSFLLYELYKDNGHLRIRRNITIYATLALAVLILTPVISWFIRSYIYSWWSTDDTSTQFFWPPHSPFELILRMVLIALNGYMEPLFPFLSTAFVGTIFGIVLSQERPHPDFPRYAFIAGILFLVTGMMLVILGVNAEPPLNFRQEIPWFLIGLGGQICSVALLLIIVEFKGHVTLFAKYTTFWRRWGMMALSIYCLQIIDFPLKLFVYIMTGKEAHVRRSLSLGWSLLMTIITIFWFDLILRIWARFNFKYSFEWWIIRLTSKTQGVESTRTQVKEIVYNVEPLVYTRSAL